MNNITIDSEIIEKWKEERVHCVNQIYNSKRRQRELNILIEAFELILPEKTKESK